jgi:F-type H+-transporting ATPase subunit delta
MSNQMSIARPYAKAIFQHALAKHQLPIWSMWLQALGELMQHSELNVLMKNSSVTRLMQADILTAIARELKLGSCPPEVERLIQLLATNQRLSVLPAITEQFNHLRAEAEKTLIVNVSSFSPLTSQEVLRLVESLTRRLQRQVTLLQTVDPSLLGGAVIRANDLVIDGSVRGQLMKLSADLAA